MISRIKKFGRLGPAKQLLLIKLWLMLAVARFRLVCGGLSHFTSGLTHHCVPPQTSGVPASEVLQALDLGRLVAIAARYTPRQSRCLTQVLVLQQLLAKRHIPGYFCLGVRRIDDSNALGFNAHAWLQCGHVIVNGATPERSYTSLSTFSWGLPV